MSAPLNKTFLAEEQRRLRIYEEYLPALELKRQQLRALWSDERRLLAELERARDEIVGRVGERLPMMAGRTIELTDLVVVSAVRIEKENVLGGQLPVLTKVELETRSYGKLTHPHWADALVRTLSEVLTLEVKIQVVRERVRRLGEATRTITQRVNLFEKVLIPRTQRNLRRIRIFLADAARYGAVRAKIAKSKKLRSVATVED